jgi:hypothetical protein
MKARSIRHLTSIGAVYLLGLLVRTAASPATSLKTGLEV